MSTEVDKINKTLLRDYGKDLLGRPIFRIVWGGNAVEKRIGKWEEWSNGIFLREYTGLKEIKKYAFAKERWVLEKLVYQPVDFLPESLQGHYEAIHTFNDRNGHYLPPKWFAVQWFIQNLLFGRKLSMEDMESENEKEYMKEVALNLDIIQNESPYLAGMLADGCAVTVPRNFERSKGL